MGCGDKKESEKCGRKGRGDKEKVRVREKTVGGVVGAR